MDLPGKEVGGHFGLINESTIKNRWTAYQSPHHHHTPGADLVRRMACLPPELCELPTPQCAASRPRRLRRAPTKGATGRSSRAVGAGAKLQPDRPMRLSERAASRLGTRGSLEVPRPLLPILSIPETTISHGGHDICRVEGCSLPGRREFASKADLPFRPRLPPEESSGRGTRD